MGNGVPEKYASVQKELYCHTLGQVSAYDQLFSFFVISSEIRQVSYNPISFQRCSAEWSVPWRTVELSASQEQFWKWSVPMISPCGAVMHRPFNDSLADWENSIRHMVRTIKVQQSWKLAGAYAHTPPCGNQLGEVNGSKYVGSLTVAGKSSMGILRHGLWKPELLLGPAILVVPPVYRAFCQRQELQNQDSECSNSQLLYLPGCRTVWPTCKLVPRKNYNKKQNVWDENTQESIYCPFSVQCFCTILCGCFCVATMLVFKPLFPKKIPHCRCLLETACVIRLGLY